MYAAMWIDSERTTANEKIVVCKPLLGREGAAVAVLNSRKREGAASVILSAEGDKLRLLLGELDQLDDRLDHLDDEDLIKAIVKMAEHFDVSPVEYGEEATDAITAAIRRIPKPKAYPRLITKPAKKIWDMLVVEHRDVLDKYKSDKRKMWAAAILILQRYAAKQNIKPFTKDPASQKVNKMAVNDINRKANNGNHKALQETEKIFENLKEAKLASRLTNEKFYESVKYKSLYYITTYQKLKLRRGVDPKAVIRHMLGTGGYGGQSGRYAFKPMNAVTDVLVEPEGGDVHLYITTHLSRDQVILLFNLPEDVVDRKVLKLLGTAGRRWVKTGVLVEI